MNWSARFAFSLIVLLLAAAALPARAADDNENSAPTAWWIYTGQSLSDIKATISAKNARVTDISVDNPNTFTVSYVQNTGGYAKAWWFYVGIDAATLEANLKTNNARLIALKAYDSGGGNIRFAVAMIANTGADAKTWWYYYGKSATEIATLTKTNNARLTSLQSYTSNGNTVYAFIMIANQGADAKGWWWYYNVSASALGSSLTANKARLINFTPAGNGNFNAVMESCSSGCPGWWWWYGVDMQGVLDNAFDNGARVMTAGSYPCNGGKCFATTMIGNAFNDIVSCDSKGCISQAKLAQNICAKLANKVVGYSCLVGGVRPGYGGVARTSANSPSLTMAPHLVTNIASVSKTITAVAVLQILAKKGLTIGTKISPYIYAEWSQGPNIAKLTFKDLLTHSTGFAQAGGCGDNITYAALKGQVAAGVAAGDIGKPSYGNCNFALLRELMLVLSGVALKPDGDQRAAQSSTAYIAYVNANVLQPVGVSLSACKPPPGTNDILSYTNPAGGTSGTDWGDWSLMCGSGGWVLSTTDIFKVISDVATGSKLLTPPERKQMINQNLGWDSAVRSDCPNPNVCKNGDLGDGAGRKVWTYAGVLKCDVPVVVAVNSPLPSPYESSGDIIGLVADAMKAAAVPGSPHACSGM